MSFCKILFGIFLYGSGRVEITETACLEKFKAEIIPLLNPKRVRDRTDVWAWPALSPTQIGFLSSCLMEKYKPVIENSLPFSVLTMAFRCSQGVFFSSVRRLVKDSALQVVDSFPVSFVCWFYAAPHIRARTRRARTRRARRQFPRACVPSFLRAKKGGGKGLQRGSIKVSK